MAEAIVEALSGEYVVHANPLATITTNCIVIHSPGREKNTIVPLSRVSSLMVISCGLLVLGAAAQVSNEGSGTAIPLGSLGLAFLLGYVVSRRAIVAFVVDGEPTATGSGSLRAAADLVKAVNKRERERAQREFGAGA